MAKVNYSLRAKAFGLSIAQYKFVLAYVANGCKNASKAYRENYETNTEKSANASASRLLSHAKVKHAISQEVNRQLRKSNTNPDHIIDILMRCIDDEDASWSERIKAADQVGKYLKMWSDRPEVQQITINMDLAGRAREVIEHHDMTAEVAADAVS